MPKKKAKKKIPKKIAIRVRVIPLKEVPIPQETAAPKASPQPKIANS